jgi:hypothetical protein
VSNTYFVSRVSSRQRDRRRVERPFIHSYDMTQRIRCTVQSLSLYARGQNSPLQLGTSRARQDTLHDYIFFFAVVGVSRFVCWFLVVLAGNVTDMLPTCRPDTAMSANFSRKGMSRRHTTGKKRPRHTVFVCRFADTTHTCPRGRRGGAAAILQRFAACSCQI